VVCEAEGVGSSDNSSGVDIGLTGFSQLGGAIRGNSPVSYGIHPYGQTLRNRSESMDRQCASNCLSSCVIESEKTTHCIESSNGILTE